MKSMMGDQLEMSAFTGHGICDQSSPVAIVDVVAEARSIDHGQLDLSAYLKATKRKKAYLDVEPPFLQICLQYLNLGRFV